MVGTGTASSIAAAIGAWWRLVKDEPAAALVVVVLFGVGVFGASWAIDHFYEPRSDFHAQMALIGNDIGKKLDNISCEVQWNRYTTQMQNYRVQERALVQQISTQKRYVEKMGQNASDHDRALLDALSTQLKYVHREEQQLPRPPCPFPFQG